jgi:hypothetical protein
MVTPGEHNGAAAAITAASAQAFHLNSRAARFTMGGAEKEAVAEKAIVSTSATVTAAAPMVGVEAPTLPPRPLRSKP